MNVTCVISLVKFNLLQLNSNTLICDKPWLGKTWQRSHLDKAVEFSSLGIFLDWVDRLNHLMFNHMTTTCQLVRINILSMLSLSQRVRNSGIACGGHLGGNCLPVKYLSPSLPPTFEWNQETMGISCTKWSKPMTFWGSCPPLAPMMRKSWLQLVKKIGS